MSFCVNNLSFSYSDTAVLNELSFQIQEGGLTSIIGPNGVGKSTLFKCLLGIQKRYEGQITVAGQDLRKIPLSKLAKMVAYVPQTNYSSFQYSVLDMVLMGTTAQMAYCAMPKKKQLEIAKQSLEMVGLAHLQGRDYQKLSGGEKQLVLVARALAQQAKVLILDEPISNMDYGNQFRVMTHIKELAAQGYTILMSTHNPEHAFLFSDYVLAILNGRLLASGKPQEVMTAPLMASLYHVDVHIESVYDDSFRVCIPKALLVPSTK